MRSLVLLALALMGCGGAVDVPADADTDADTDAAPLVSCTVGDMAYYCGSWSWTWGDGGACADCPSGASCTVSRDGAIVQGICQ